MKTTWCAVALLAGVACGSSPTGNQNPPPPTPPGPTTIVVTMTDNTFGASNLTVAAGTVVRWENGGLMAHTSTSNTGAWDSGNMSPGYTSGGYFYAGGTYQRTFSTAGTFAYSCTNHAAQGMTATVTVTP